MGRNANLHKARAVQNDEFYTRLTDVSKELMHYKQHFQGKVVFCNCDDPVWSAFWRYFHLNFGVLRLKGLISTYYDPVDTTYKMEYAGGDDGTVEAGVKTPLKGNGDFRSEECVELLKASDIVVTNPPFSIAREDYIPQLFRYDKKFLIIGDLNWATYKFIFPLLQHDQMWLGYNPVKEFLQPDGTVKKFGNKLWFTNLDHEKRHERLLLRKRYDVATYPKYVNYDGINVDKVSDIPVDYDGVMGVPVSFLDKYNPDQFEIVGFDQADRIPIQDCGLPKGSYTPSGSRLYVKESDDWYRMCYARILIRRKDGAI